MMGPSAVGNENAFPDPAKTKWELVNKVAVIIKYGPFPVVVSCPETICYSMLLILNFEGASDTKYVVEKAFKLT
jgi:hypothetical protein